MTFKLRQALRAGAMAATLWAGMMAAPMAKAQTPADALADTVPPTVLSSDLSGPRDGIFSLHLTFSEAIEPLTAADFKLTNVRISVLGSGADYVVTITPIGQGHIGVRLPVGAVTDAAGNSNPAQYAMELIYTASQPSVQLSTQAGRVSSRAPITVHAAFSEPVIGLTAGDIRVGGGAVRSVGGSGEAYEIVVLPSGAGDLTVAIPADAAHSNQGTGNLASDTLWLGNQTAALTEERLGNFMLHRADALLASQPDLIARLRQRKAQAFTLSEAGADLDLAFRNSWSGGLWADLRGRWSRDDGLRSDYMFGVIGADLIASDRLLFGAMLQFDDMSERDSTGFARGHGWLAGPYVAGQIGDHALFYEARLLTGRSQNSLSIDGGDVVSQFETRRWLGSFGLAGEVQRGALTLTPKLVISKTSDRQAAFVDGYGNAVAGRRMDLVQGELGLDVQRSFALTSGQLRVNGGAALVFSDGGRADLLASSPVADLRGKGWLGFARESANGLSYSADLALDGLGTGEVVPQIGMNWRLQF